MKVLVEDLANQSLNNILYFNMRYSLKYSIEVDSHIKNIINSLVKFPYIGRYIKEIPNKRFREIIYNKSKNSGYRIMYYISKKRKIYLCL